MEQSKHLYVLENIKAMSKLRKYFKDLENEKESYAIHEWIFIEEYMSNFMHVVSCKNIYMLLSEKNYKDIISQILSHIKYTLYSEHRQIIIDLYNAIK